MRCDVPPFWAVAFVYPNGKRLSRQRVRYAATGEGAAAAAHYGTMRGSLETCCYRRGVSEPGGAATPAGSCCFRLGELARIVLRFRECVKYYLTPLAIGVAFMDAFHLTPLAIVGHFVQVRLRKFSSGHSKGSAETSEV